MFQKTAQWAMFASSLVLSTSCTESNAQNAVMDNFSVAVQNVTADNLLSPYLVIVHKADTSLIDAGATASPGLQEVAETGGTDIIQTELASNANVLSVSKVEGMPLTATESRSLVFSLNHDQVESGAVVTVIAMIGKSNDSFIALRNVPLNTITSTNSVFDASNFDAGTEENTGHVADFGPAGHPVAASEGHISYDRGLNAKGDAPEILGWGPIAAKISLKKN